MTDSLARLSHLAEGDNLAKADRLALYKLAASCGAGSKSIHGRIYDWWAEFDREIFDGKLSPCLIVIGATERRRLSLQLCAFAPGPRPGLAGFVVQEPS